MKCKLTNKEINPFMTFGKMPLAKGFLSKKAKTVKYIFI